MAKKILIIEDDEGIRGSLSEILEMNGLEIIQAGNGEIGILKLSNHKPDLVISDIMMPVMDGYEVVRRIRNNPETELIPVLLLTAKVDLDSKLKGLELGANDYLTKPFEYKELLLKIRNTLDQYDKLKKIKEVADVNSLEYSSSDEVLMNKINLLIEEQILRTDVRVEYLAEKLFMSASTLQRRIKKITGLSPVKYIQVYRLRKARNMILMNYGNLSEIAFKTGFGSVSYFSTAYTKFFGNNPKEDFAG